MKERNKWIALVITVFGGWFGIHKFYLGENAAGVLYLLFCWSGIPGIISIFDFLWLLLVSEQEFDRRFNMPILEEKAQSQRNPQEITDTLSSLKRLYEEGVITAGEYEEKRQKLLKDL
ncbi:NINE protein [Geitlerinema sp. PCC 9228]|uniref:NINE protein n=1 Tax=Geitlerinema sp. PCC 9228 TaxID=111611 RepID=UPI0008F9D263|nr:NINE protein [Geitlerinema sp. PCC 9228]